MVSAIFQQFSLFSWPFLTFGELSTKTRMGRRFLALRLWKLMGGRLAVVGRGSSAESGVRFSSRWDCWSQINQSQLPNQQSSDESSVFTVRLGWRFAEGSAVIPINFLFKEIRWIFIKEWTNYIFLRLWMNFLEVRWAEIHFKALNHVVDIFWQKSSILSLQNSKTDKCFSKVPKSQTFLNLALSEHTYQVMLIFWPGVPDTKVA